MFLNLFLTMIKHPFCLTLRETLLLQIFVSFALVLHMSFFRQFVRLYQSLAEFQDEFKRFKYCGTALMKWSSVSFPVNICHFSLDCIHFASEFSFLVNRDDLA